MIDCGALRSRFGGVFRNRRYKWQETITKLCRNFLQTINFTINFENKNWCTVHTDKTDAPMFFYFCCHKCRQSSVPVGEVRAWVLYSRDSSRSTAARLVERRPKTLRTLCSSRAVSVRLRHRPLNNRERQGPTTGPGTEQTILYGVTFSKWLMIDFGYQLGFGLSFNIL